MNEPTLPDEKKNTVTADASAPQEEQPATGTAQPSATVMQEDPAAAAAKNAAAPAAGGSQCDISASLPLLLSIAALIFAVYAFYIAQQGNDQQNARLQSLAVRVDGVEAQTRAFDQQLREREARTGSQQAALVHTELELMAASLARIAPMATGEDKATIAGLRQLLANGNTEYSDGMAVHGTAEAVPLNE